MRNRVVIGQAVLGCVLLACAGAAFGQEKPARGERRSFMGLINIDSLVDNYSNFLARKYNLNPEQDEFTHQLLREKAREFWDKNEGQLSVLMDRMFDVRTGGEMSAEELIEWGKSVNPLYAEAKSIIVQGNDEWREILNDEQRKIHDEDLKLMNQSFATTDGQIERIVSGAMTVDEFRSPSRAGRNAPPPPAPPPQTVNENPTPQTGEMSPERAEKLRQHEAEQRAAEEGGEPIDPQQEGAEPPMGDGDPEATDDDIARMKAEKAEQHRRESEGEEPVEEPVPQPEIVEQPQPEHVPVDAPPPPPTKGGEAPPPGDPRHAVKSPVVSKGFEGEWEQYTRQFIARFKLNDEQTQRANAILADCKQQGVRHMNSKKAEIDRLDLRVAELQRNKAGAKSTEFTALTQQRQKLMEPLSRIFEQQLKPGLEKLPTRAQREAAEVAAKTPVKPGPGGTTVVRPAAPTPKPGERAGDAERARPGAEKPRPGADKSRPSGEKP